MILSKKDRFYKTLYREEVDKPCWWVGLPESSALSALYKSVNVNNFYDFKMALDDDIWTIELPYKDGKNNKIYMAFDFAKQTQSLETRTLNSAGFFEDYEDSDAVDLFNFPDPARCIFKSDCEELVANAPKGYPILGVLWSSHFQDACAAFGMEDALVKMKIAPDLFSAVTNKILDFYLKANEIFFEYTKGKIDAVLIGNDFGTQESLICSPNDLRTFIFDGTRKLVEQAHSYGVKVIHHSCGAIDSIIPDLIDCGVDAIHPIQALAKDMQADKLKAKYGDKVSFCGGIDAQNLLPNGTTDMVEKEVLRLRDLFKTGLIISPSHEAILPDIPPQNVLAISKTMKN